MGWMEKVLEARADVARHSADRSIPLSDISAPPTVGQSVQIVLLAKILEKLDPTPEVVVEVPDVIEELESLTVVMADEDEEQAPPPEREKPRRARRRRKQS